MALLRMLCSMLVLAVVLMGEDRRPLDLSRQRRSTSSDVTLWATFQPHNEQERAKPIQPLFRRTRQEQLTMRDARGNFLVAMERFLGAQKRLLGARKRFLGARQLFVRARERFLGTRENFLSVREEEEDEEEAQVQDNRLAEKQVIIPDSSIFPRSEGYITQYTP